MLDARGGLTQAQLDEVARVNRLFRVTVLSASGERELSAGTGGPRRAPAAASGPAREGAAGLARAGDWDAGLAAAAEAAAGAPPTLAERDPAPAAWRARRTAALRRRD